MCKLNMGISRGHVSKKNQFAFSLEASLCGFIYCTSEDYYSIALILRVIRRVVCPNYLRVGEFAVTPSSVDHVSLSNHFCLRFVVCEPDKPKPLGVASLCIPLDLKWTKVKHIAEQ